MYLVWQQTCLIVVRVLAFEVIYALGIKIPEFSDYLSKLTYQFYLANCQLCKIRFYNKNFSGSRRR